jgi:hypothetical protein
LSYGVAKPTSDALCGLAAALSVNVIVPARFAPRAESVLVNRTCTVHVAPGASTVPVQVSPPTTALNKNVDALPPETATLVTVNCAPAAAEVFFSVAVPIPVFTPVGNVMVRGFGVIDTVAFAVTPVPVSGTGVGVTVAAV